MVKTNDFIIRHKDNEKNVLPDSEENNKIAEVLNNNASLTGLMLLNYMVLSH